MSSWSSSKRCLHLSEPNHGTGEDDEGSERGECFFASQGDPTKPFDLVEETLDEVALLVEHPINGQFLGPAGVLFDLGLRAEVLGDEAAQMVGVAGGISNDMANALKSGDQTLCLRAVAPVPRRDLDAHRQVERINGGIDFGRQSAPGTADRTSFKLSFCKVASAWTFEIVTSTS